MDLILVDDSKQKRPSRPGMGDLVAVGGLHIPSDGVQGLTRRLDEICDAHGFPDRAEEFKWSPGKGSWMRRNLTGVDRQAFFVDCIEAAREERAEALVVVQDRTRRSTAGNRNDHEMECVKVFLERSNQHLRSVGAEAMVIADNPSGGRKAEALFVAECMETLRDGTRFVDFDNLTLVLTQDSKNTRLLQLADLIVGCTVACVSGEDEYSPALFDEQIKGMLRKEGGRIGGVGLKLHPDYCFANLYHWLLGDTTFWKGNGGRVLPMKGWPYVNSPTDDSTTKVIEADEGLISF